MEQNLHKDDDSHSSYFLEVLSNLRKIVSHPYFFCAFH
jgi:hypothetical protein